MPISFFILSGLVIIGAIAAMTMRNLVHCALALALTFVGLAGLFLQLNAQFIGLVQILVYVGAVSIVIVFAILLTRGGDAMEPPLRPSGTITGALIAAVVFGVFIWGVSGLSRTPPANPVSPPDSSVRQIGEAMMKSYVAPLEAVALLLTAALIGAMLLALREKSTGKEPDAP